MTLGEKIREARKKAGLTQEQLAEKLMISRPAITKWEIDRGLPDIENLKALSKLLNVSLDQLLDDGSGIDLNVIKEEIDLKAYGKGIKKKRKDRIVRAKYPDAQIFALLPEKVLTKSEKTVDNLLGWLTDAGFGIPDLLNSVKLAAKEYYLVVQNDSQYLVSIGDEWMETRRMTVAASTVSGSRFQIGEIKYTVIGSKLYT